MMPGSSATLTMPVLRARPHPGRSGASILAPGSTAEQALVLGLLAVLVGLPSLRLGDPLRRWLDRQLLPDAAAAAADGRKLR